MHEIRLRRPWLRFGLDDQPTKVDAPELAPGSGATSSTIRYQRSFNLPTGLSDRESVVLVIESCVGRHVKILLNDQVLLSTEQFSGAFPFAAEINDKLVSHNVLSIHLTGAEDQPALLNGEVKLQLESEA